jgi:hypothetical protein
MENSTFITDSELTTYINESYAELYDLIIASYEDYYTTEVSLTASSQAGVLTLPSDFYKLRGLDKAAGGSNIDYTTVYKYNFNERNKRPSLGLRAGYGLYVEYRIVKNEIKLEPKAAADGTYRLWYMPQITFLVADGDLVDAPAGFDEYIVIDAGIKCLAKEESDTMALDRAKALMTARIENMAVNRDADQPETISDVQDDLLGPWGI